MKPPVYLVDASIYVFRAWFVLPDSLTDREGNPVNAVHGFLDFVHQLLHETRDGPIGFCFDESLETSHRREIWPQYKANRESAPEELKYQFRLCRRFLRALGLPEFASNRYEADDLIGTLARIHRARGHGIHIVTGDKDLAQLIRDGDTWWDHARSNRLDARGIRKRFGVPPERIADQLAIAGDKSDNIPGVPGIGMTTAARLLTRFGDLDTLLDSLHLIGSMKTRGARRIQALMSEHANTVRMSRRLTGIVETVPIDDPALERRPPDLEALEALFDLLQWSPARRERWMRIASGKGLGTGD